MHLISKYIFQFLLLVVVLGSTEVCAQFVLQESITVPLAEQDRQFGITPAGEEGVVLFHEILNHTDLGKRKWGIRILDKDLSYSWSSLFESELNYTIHSVKYQEGRVYILFLDTNIPMGNVFFARFSIEKSDIEFFQISDFLPNEISGFEVLGNSLFLIGNTNKRPSILRFNYGDQRPQVLEGLYNEKNEILHTSVNLELGFMQIISQLRKTGAGNVIIVKHFNESGDLQKVLVLESPRGYQMINARAVTDVKGNTTVAGTFAYRKSNYSNGIFSTVFSGEELNEVYYYDYINLYNYFEYLNNPSKEERIRKRFAKSGTNKSLNVHHVPRMLVQQDEQVIFLGEVFQMADKQSAYPGNFWREEYTKYSHAVAFGIDDEGKLLWDNSLPMNNLISSSGFQQTYLSDFERNKILFYADGSDLNYKIINDMKQVHAPQLFDTGDMELPHDPENLESVGNVLPWYDNSYLVFGIHSVAVSESQSSRYFFIKKVKVAPTPTQ